MSIIVQKFGGTSLANKSRIEAVAHIVKESIQQDLKPIVIVSAPAGITDNLVKNIDQFQNYNMREYDAIVASGEIMSAGLLAISLNNIGIKAESLQAWQIKIHSDNRFGCATIKMIENQNIFKMLEVQVIPIICGFQGIFNNNITTLGRGGSDTTAVAIAVAVNAKRCDIYTDVDGIYTLDPKQFKKAKKIEDILYDHVINMAYSGAKVLNYRAAKIGKKYNMPIRVLSSFESIKGGTIISNENMHNIEETKLIAITVLKNLYLIDIQYQFCTSNINVLSITQEKNGYIATIEASEKDLHNLNSHILQKSKPLCKITLTGHNLKEDSDLINAIFKASQDFEARIIKCIWGEISIVIYIENYSDEFINQLHDNFLS